MQKLEYDDKRLLMFLSGCLVLGIILGFTIGFLIPPSQTKINNQSLIQNFNKAHSNMLNAYTFEEYSDDEKVKFITGYDMGFQQGREHEISKYNENQAQKQEVIHIEKQINELELQEKKLDKFIKSHDNRRKKNQHSK